MAVAKAGAAGSTNAGGNPASPLNLTYTVSTSADTLVVGVGLGTNTSPVGTVSGVTYAGTAMTQVVTQSDTGGPFERAYLFRLLAPATGANTVAVSFTSGASVQGIVAGAQGFIGVDQTTPVSNSNSNRGKSTTASVTVTSATGEWTIDTVVAGSSISAPTKTQDWLVNQTNDNSGGSDAAGAASVAYQWTVSAVDLWVDLALSLKATGAGGSVVSPRTLSLLGVGA